MHRKFISCAPHMGCPSEFSDTCVAVAVFFVQCIYRDKSGIDVCRVWKSSSFTSEPPSFGIQLYKEVERGQKRSTGPILIDGYPPPVGFDDLRQFPYMCVQLREVVEEGTDWF
jgi:hypothetical protein